MDKKIDITKLIRTKKFNRYELKTKTINDIEFTTEPAYGYDTNDVVRLYMIDGTVYEFVSRPGAMEKPTYYAPSTYIDVWKYVEKEELEVVPPVDIDEVIDKLKHSIEKKEIEEPARISIGSFWKLFEISSKKEEKDIIKRAKSRGLKITLTDNVVQFSS